MEDSGPVKAIILILDGVGVGRQDEPGNPCPADANTLANTGRAASLRLPVMESLGLGNIAALPGVAPVSEPLASHGKCRLAYNGADSYLGHQEILGVTPPRAHLELLADSRDRIRNALEKTGRRTRPAVAWGSALLVDDAIVICDNLEATPGAAVNLLIPTATTTFEDGIAVGQIVREEVGNLRVIVCGGEHFTTDEALRNLVILDTGQVGVPTPSLALYDETYQVRHLGLPVDSHRQLPYAFAQHELPVGLFGKVSDLVADAVDARSSAANTTEVMSLVLDHARSWAGGLIVATVQETDLAGHQQDPQRMARVLATVDAALPALLAALGTDDMLAVTADHGNDPTIQTSAHTRETIPLLWYQPRRAGTNLGIRSSLSDPAATVAALFGFQWSGEGEPLPLICEHASVNEQRARRRPRT
jgi:phosphopentomutase